MKTYRKDIQEDGTILWEVTHEDGSKTLETDIKNWNQLRLSLFGSKAFQRALANPNTVNGVAYGALQTILSTEGNVDYLLFALQNTMQYYEVEKIELNKILTDNNFTIQII